MGFNAMICTVANHCNIYKFPFKYSDMISICIIIFSYLLTEVKQTIGRNYNQLHHPSCGVPFNFLYLLRHNKLFHDVIRVLPTDVSHWALFI